MHSRHCAHGQWCGQQVALGKKDDFLTCTEQIFVGRLNDAGTWHILDEVKRKTR
jgi:hypothetical protein